MPKPWVGAVALALVLVAAGYAAAGTVVLDEPRVVRAVVPRYPDLPAQIIGYVWVDATVDAGGAVTDVTVVRSPALLDEEPLRAARLWRFEPSAGTKARTVRLTFVFDLVPNPSEGDLYPAFVPPYRVETKAKCDRKCGDLEQRRATAFRGLK